MDLDWLGVIKILHIGITALPWIIALWFRKAWVILICLAIQIVVMTQWIVLGRCFLNSIENGGTSAESETMMNVAEWFQIPFDEFKHGFVLINSLAPSFLQMSRLAGALKL